MSSEWLAKQGAYSRVQAVANKVAELIRKGDKEFVICNFAPPDIVGLTCVYEAAVEAISATDNAITSRRFTSPVRKRRVTSGYILLITADMGTQIGDLKKLNFTVDKKDGEEEGALCDVAPTVLDITGWPKPEGKEDRSLVPPARLAHDEVNKEAN
ncbi:uncharacterized protein LAESUDRAFT_815777 [Laetiporus sulphureus 93-53]|uniref:Metalloenzyme domain-containing protein n=1 Tax=Laetiporus sulphureus 93-53 TaxID=1314785 RepID=A0A165BT41_9APHY|nr:uncharacterized protein LAESUDRAFT_815777 [Laetiporus sulphureus 93-53]KZT01600.1 hypothetical protein LAESUDRAFT_815777 [Laetiporus sulphureus 93-53]